MKAISRFFCLFLLIFVALSGCTTIEDPLSKEPPGQVTVYREPSSRDSFFPMRINVDGRPVTVLYPDEVRSLEIKAGEHRLTYELGVYNCAADVRIESGKTYVYRLARGCVIELDDGTRDGGTIDRGKWDDGTRDEEHDADESDKPLAVSELGEREDRRGK